MPRLPSPGQVDILSGRPTATRLHLKELVDSAARHQHPVPICSLLLDKIAIIETTALLQQQTLGVGSRHLMSVDESQRAADIMFKEVMNMLGRSQSSIELKYWVLRSVTFVSFVVMVYFLVFH